MLSVSKFMTLLPLAAVDLPQSAADVLRSPTLQRVQPPYTGGCSETSPNMLCRSHSWRVARNDAVRRDPNPRVAACRAHAATMPRPSETLEAPRTRGRRGGRGRRSGMLESTSLPARRRVGVRPDSSVVEHLHGKEKVKSSILFRGSDRHTAYPAAARPRGGVAQVVRAHGS